MQCLQIPDDRSSILTAVAHATGYADVSAFVKAMAEKPTDDLRGALTKEQLRDGIAECDQSMAEFDSGGGRDAEQALIEIGRKRGFDMGE